MNEWGLVPSAFSATGQTAHSLPHRLVTRQQVQSTSGYLQCEGGYLPAAVVIDAAMHA